MLVGVVGIVVVLICILCNFCKLYFYCFVLTYTAIAVDYVYRDGGRM